MQWKKCPSVTHGGKAFFYHNRDYGWVLWDRESKSWSISREDCDYDILGFHTYTQAQKESERMGE